MSKEVSDTSLFKKLLTFFVLLLMVAVIAVTIYFGPQNIIQFLGVENTYLFIFLFAILDGVSFLTSASFFSILVVISKELDILTLIVISSLGLVIGDLFYYFVGRNLSHLGKETMIDEKVTKLKVWFEKVPKGLMFFVIFLYTSISPFPKDVLCIVLGLINYPLHKSMIPIFLGNALFVFLLLKGFELVL